MSMKKALRIAMVVLYVFFLIIIQTTVLSHIRILGVMPNLLLCATICFSLISSDYRGIIFAGVCGLLLDMTGGRLIGVNTLLLLYASLGILLICDKLYNNNEIVAAIITFVITAVYAIVIYITNFLIWGETAVFFALLRKIIPEMIYNTVASVFLYPITKRILLGSRKRNRQKKELYLK